MEYSRLSKYQQSQVLERQRQRADFRAELNKMENIFVWVVFFHDNDQLSQICSSKKTADKCVSTAKRQTYVLKKKLIFS